MSLFKLFGLLVVAAVATAGSILAAEQAPVKTQNTSDESLDKKTVTEKGGDTYNFYFQKAPGAQKVKQGDTQTVEQTGTERTETTVGTYPKDDRSRHADLFLGMIALPPKSSVGVSVGAHIYAGNVFGVRLGVFTATNTSDDGDTSSFSAYGTDSTSNTNSYFGGDLALSVDISRSNKIRLSPLLGIQIIEDKNTKEIHSFSAFGSGDSKASNSTVKVAPYIGMSGTFYFTERFGANLTVSIPTEPRYSTFCANLAFNI